MTEVQSPTLSTTDHGASISTDSRLVEDTRRGRTSAYGDLVERYERRLVRVIGRFIRDPYQAEDLAQETFLRAFIRLGQFDTSRRFGPWLFRIGVNLTMDHLRKVKRRGRSVLFSESSSKRPPDPPVEDPRGDLDLRQEVRCVLEDVPEKYRTVLVLRDLENFSTSEIAAILDRKEATIRWRLAEARQRFQKLWLKRLDRDAAAEISGRCKREDRMGARR
ncbi:MAG: RNA polymerase subunit sigma [Planctomycetaceae bacterium]|nr:RNA polymerase subunit sigma [Planctomycetaceae bacterium]MDP7274077.1 sigma-70 family RNA polymerase sigma factor [Planctomycetaceae bacterium]